MARRLTFDVVLQGEIAMEKDEYVERRYHRKEGMVGANGSKWNIVGCVAIHVPVTALRSIFAATRRLRAQGRGHDGAGVWTYVARIVAKCLTECAFVK